MGMSKRVAVGCLAIAFALTAMVGCESDRRSYLRKNATFHKVKRVLVLPFENLSKTKIATEIILNAFEMEMLLASDKLGSNVFKVVSLADAEKALKEARIRASSGVSDLSPAQLKKLADALMIDAVIVGTIEKFDKGSKKNPEISLYTKMLDVNDASVLWAVNLTTTGESRNIIFDIGRLGNQDVLGRSVVRSILRPLFKAAKNSEKKARKLVNKSRAVAEALESRQDVLEAESGELALRYQDAVATHKDLERQAREAERKVLASDPEALQAKMDELIARVADAESLVAEVSTRQSGEESRVRGLESEIKQLEADRKNAQADSENKAGQVNIYIAKQRVAAIRQNQEEAEKFKRLAEDAKMEAEAAKSLEAEVEGTLKAAKAQSETMRPAVEKARAETAKAKQTKDAAEAQLAEIKKLESEVGVIEDAEALSSAEDYSSLAVSLRAQADSKALEIEDLAAKGERIKAELVAVSKEATEARIKATADHEKYIGEEVDSARR